MAKLWVYVGTSENAVGRGIYRFPFDTVTGKAGAVELAAEAARPTFLAIHPSQRFLYAVNAIGEFQGQKTGAVSAFALDGKTGELRLLNQQSSGGAGPSHVVVDREGRNALVANYGGGSVACLPIDAEGRLKPPTSVIQHTGASVNPARQEGPHAHSINLDAANRFAFAADLGLDQILIYRYDTAPGTLTPHNLPSVATAPGAGPRHFAFHPSGRFAYVINELTSTVTAFRYDADAGVLREVQTVSTLPEHFDGANTGAEIDVHPSGKWLYASNRGHNSVVLFSVDSDKGTLTYVEEQGTGGFKPRHFGIEPSATYLAVGNQDSDTILVARVDAGNGRLKPSGILANAPSPVCIKFLPPK